MTARTAAAGETVAELVEWLRQEAGSDGRLYGQESTWKASVERRIRAAVAREQQGRLV